MNLHWIVPFFLLGMGLYMLLTGKFWMREPDGLMKYSYTEVTREENPRYFWLNVVTCIVGAGLYSLYIVQKFG